MCKEIYNEGMLSLPSFLLKVDRLSTVIAFNEG